MTKKEASCSIGARFIPKSWLYISITPRIETEYETELSWIPCGQITKQYIGWDRSHVIWCLPSPCFM